MDEQDVEERLDELDHNLARLRIEYEQYFAGTLRRAPEVLQGKVQKVILQFAAEMPRNTGQRFRFNQLNSRFQVMRQQWGRTMRQIEAGTYKPHVFKARLHERLRGRAPAAPPAPAPPPGGDAPRTAADRARDPVDQLFEALAEARRRTGEPAPDRQRVADLVRQHTEQLRARRQGGRIRFKVVIEGNAARLKASVSRS
jgi:hypothetical protein